MKVRRERVEKKRGKRQDEELTNDVSLAHYSSILKAMMVN